MQLRLPDVILSVDLFVQATARLPGFMAESDGSSIGERGDRGEGRG